MGHKCSQASGSQAPKLATIKSEGVKSEPLAPQNQDLGRWVSLISHGRQFILETESSDHKPE
jgi:hypothetical protein